MSSGMARPGSVSPAVGPVGYKEHLAGAGEAKGGMHLWCTVPMGQKPASAPLGQIPPPVTKSEQIVVGNGSAGVTEPRCGSGGVHTRLCGLWRGRLRHAARVASKSRFCPPGSNSSPCDEKWGNVCLPVFGQGSPGPRRVPWGTESPSRAEGAAAFRRNPTSNTPK